MLLLDESDGLLSVLSNYLRASGYDVQECASPETAIRRFKMLEGAVDLLITDISRGVSREAEAAIELWMCDNRLRLLFLSDRTRDKWSIFDTALFLELPKDAVRVLQKPFSVLDLLIQVNDLIGLPETRAAERASA